MKTNKDKIVYPGTLTIGKRKIDGGINTWVAVDNVGQLFPKIFAVIETCGVIFEIDEIIVWEPNVE